MAMDDYEPSKAWVGEHPNKEKLVHMWDVHPQRVFLNFRGRSEIPCTPVEVIPVHDSLTIVIVYSNKVFLNVFFEKRYYSFVENSY